MAQATFFTLDGPLDLLPVDGQCRAANFAGLAGVARNFGRDARGIIERHGMEPHVLSHPESLNAPHQLADTFEYCTLCSTIRCSRCTSPICKIPKWSAASPHYAAPQQLSAPTYTA